MIGNLHIEAKSIDRVYNQLGAICTDTFKTSILSTSYIQLFLWKTVRKLWSSRTLKAHSNYLLGYNMKANLYANWLFMTKVILIFWHMKKEIVSEYEWHCNIKPLIVNQAS